MGIGSLDADRPANIHGDLTNPRQAFVNTLCTEMADIEVDTAALAPSSRSDLLLYRTGDNVTRSEVKRLRAYRAINRSPSLLNRKPPSPRAASDMRIFVPIRVVG